MISHESDSSVFADTRNVGSVREYITGALERRGVFHDSSESKHYLISSCAFIVRAVNDQSPAEAIELNEAIDQGMAPQVAVEKVMGDTLTRCINNEQMSLNQFFDYAEIAVAYSSLAGNQPAAELMQRYLDEPDACLV